MVNLSDSKRASFAELRYSVMQWKQRYVSTMALYGLKSSMRNSGIFSLYSQMLLLHECQHLEQERFCDSPVVD